MSAQKHTSSWPVEILLVRHGQSAGNVALEEAEAKGASIIDIAHRDVDVPLSALGEEQARALGAWLASLPESEQPTVVLASPYVRAQETAGLITAQLKKPPEILFDERLREREFGIVDRLTRKGILEKFPDQAELHARLKKFYYRAPGGESWCDVILRLRSVQDSLARDYPGERVMIVCHTVVVFCFRYLFENLTEQEILAIDRQEQLANCSLTTYRHDAAKPASRPLALDKFNFTAPLAQAGASITRKPDAQVAPK
ncbi:MAG: histidine phosphatase family protein [Proteobacteria bacterium]|nr:MAG: histidine phosphatase family protein [Pseudomonadota bacterium]